MQLYFPLQSSSLLVSPGRWWRAPSNRIFSFSITRLTTKSSLTIPPRPIPQQHRNNSNISHPFVQPLQKVVVARQSHSEAFWFCCFRSWKNQNGLDHFVDKSSFLPVGRLSGGIIRRGLSSSSSPPSKRGSNDMPKFSMCSLEARFNRVRVGLANANGGTIYRRGFSSSSSSPPPSKRDPNNMPKFNMYGLEASFNQVKSSLTNVDIVRKGGFVVNETDMHGPVMLLPDLALLWRGLCCYSLSKSKITKTIQMTKTSSL